MSGLELGQLSENCGLYTGQSGYQHPDIDDYQQALANYQQSDQSKFSHLWHSRQLNPFLAIKGLPNNLLGLISIELGIKGDCSAFAMDHQGAATALNEALFNLQHGFVDRALVISAGTERDIFEICINQYKNGIQEEFPRPTGGAVTLLLEREDKVKNPVAYLSNPRHGYALSANSSLKNKEEIESSYCDQREPRWGGIVWGIIHAVDKLKSNQINLSKPLTIKSYGEDNFSASVDIALKSESLL